MVQQGESSGAVVRHHIKQIVHEVACQVHTAKCHPLKSCRHFIHDAIDNPLIVPVEKQSSECDVYVKAFARSTHSTGAAHTLRGNAQVLVQ